MMADTAAILITTISPAGAERSAASKVPITSTHRACAGGDVLGLAAKRS